MYNIYYILLFVTSYFVKSSPENVAVQKVAYAPSYCTIFEKIKSFQFLHCDNCFQSMFLTAVKLQT